MQGSLESDCDPVTFYLENLSWVANDLLQHQNSPGRGRACSFGGEHCSVMLFHWWWWWLPRCQGIVPSLHSSALEVAWRKLGTILELLCCCWLCAVDGVGCSVHLAAELWGKENFLTLPQRGKDEAEITEEENKENSHQTSSFGHHSTPETKKTNWLQDESTVPSAHYLCKSRP